MLKIAVLGATGRMGRAIIECIAEDDNLTLAGAVVGAGNRHRGQDAAEVAGLSPAGVLLTDDVSAAVDAAQVVIDFTLPDALPGNLAACLQAGRPLVCGTTGLSETSLSAINAAALELPIVYGRNMSVGVNAFLALVAAAARALGDDYDVEIIEAHHRHKVDAPSGTALEVGEAIAGARQRRLADVAVHARHGHTGPRVPGTIGFSVVRGGDVVGDHTALFLAAEERLELTHRAQDRKTFARGAVRAAQWLSGRAPGLYSMRQVLGL